MSVYSGFSTRNQEATYYKLVEGLINLLQSRALYCLKSYPRADDNLWLQKFSNLYSNMKNLEFHKYLEPKLTESCRELASYCSIDISLDPIYSDISYNKFQAIKVNNSIKGLSTPRKKQQAVRVKTKIEKEKKSTEKLGMSQYYGKIMDNFLGKTKSVSPKKKNKPSMSLDTQDFWLLDDKITVMNNDVDF